MEPRKLYKDRSAGMLCGVCAGIAEYIGLDVTIVRLLTVALGATSTGVLLYIIAAILMPEKPGPQ